MTYLDGRDNGFAFKRSIIEGKNIDENAAERIVSIIEMIMLGNEKPRVMRAVERTVSKVAGSLGSASENLSRAASAPALKCPGCGESITAEDAFCVSCGHTLH